MKKYIGVLILVGIIIGCKRDKGPEKEEVQSFLAQSGSAATDLSQSEAMYAMNPFINNPPPATMVKAFKKAVKHFYKDEYKYALQSFKVQDWSVSCMYGTWTYIYPVWKMDTNACGDTFYSYWDYVHNIEDTIKFIWDYVYEGDSSKAKFLLYNISFYNNIDSLPTSLSARLFSDGTLLMEFNFEADYEPSSLEATRVYFDFKVPNEGEFAIEVKAESGRTIEEEPFVGTVKGHITNYKQNYTFNYEFTTRVDSSFSIVLWDSDGWELKMNFGKPVHTVHPPYDPHYKHDITGEVKKDGKKGAELEGELWVTEPEGDPEHRTWIKVIFNDGSEEDLRKYFGFIPVVSSLLD
jgi:hypothetical protein